MNIYKLNFADKQEAELTFLALGVYIETDEGFTYANGIQAVVDIGKIVKVEGIYDENGNVITEPIYYDGVFYDVMSIKDIDFGINEVHPSKFVHSFLGYNE